MLKNLLKAEWRENGRTLALLYLGTTGVVLLAGLLMGAASMFPVLASTAAYTTIVALTCFLAALAILVMSIGCVFINVRSFYNLLGQRGYLMLSLPATVEQHMLAKLIFAVVSTVACAVFFFADMAFLMAGNGINLVAELFVGNGFAPSDLPITLYLIVLMVLGMAASYLFFYLAVAIGGQWAQQRLLASVIAFFVLQFVVQLLFILLVVLFGLGLTAVVPHTATGYASVQLVGDGIPLLVGIGTVVLLLSLAWNAILWGITRYFMTKKLNLA